jgi:hypothetical protein
MQSDIGLEINPQQIFELAMKGRYGVANERIINSLKESIKKNDVFVYFLFLYLVVRI